jgi:glucosamine--fructose-6-phosphate aminotransferase (isomerizing)
MMWREIQEQPGSYLRVSERAVDFLAGARPKGPLSSRFLSSVDDIVIFGNGSSFHAACLAREYFLNVTGIAARAEYASDAFVYPQSRPRRTLAVAFSHSGSSSDVRGAVKRAVRQGIRTIGITNIESSPLTRETDVCLVTGAGVENAVPSTKGFTAVAAASLFVACYVSEQRGGAKGPAFASRKVKRAVRGLEDWLRVTDRVQSAADLVARARAVAFVGKGFLYPVASDGALKLLEVAYLPALAYPPEEFRHGPTAIADERFVLVALMPRRRDQALIRVMDDVKATGARIIAVGETLPSVADIGLELPPVDPIVSPLVAMPALQLLAYEVGVRLGRPIDRPRGLQKVVGAA